MILRNLSLFTGSGIGDLAAKEAGIVTVAQCENDPACLYCLERLWPEAKRFKDVHDVSAKSLRKCGVWPIDIISGGFPCQDLSTAGRGAGIEGSRSGLWREMFRVIYQVRPAWLIIENVPAIRLRGVDRVLAPLERIGYTCWPLVVGAWAVGAPHKRDRVWIVGRRLDKPECRGLVGQSDATPESGGDGTADGLPVSASGLGNTQRERLEGAGSERWEQSRLRECVGALLISDGELANTRCLSGSGGRDPGDLAEATGTPEADSEQRERLRDSASDGGAVGKLGHSAGDRQRWAGGGQRRQPRTIGGSSGSGDMADADPGHGRASGRPATDVSPQCDHWPLRWPSRPGEPQHAWEAPRLVEPGVGGPTDGISRRVLSKARKSALRILGNAWVWQIPYLIYRWIAAQ